MALDSESRWRLVRMKRAKGNQEPESTEPVIRKATEADLTSMVEIYNYYIQNSVVTNLVYLLSLPRAQVVKLLALPMLLRGDKKRHSSAL
ncbi:MAG: hypothetical protein RL351_997 [Actinomycetota bacterium]